MNFNLELIQLFYIHLDKDFRDGMACLLVLACSLSGDKAPSKFENFF